MKQIAVLLIAVISVLIVSAQTKADIEVSYRYELPNFKTGKRTVKNQYVLLANTTESKFYSPRTESIDSMRSTPDGQAKLGEITKNAYLSGKLKTAPKADGSFYVTKSLSANRLSHYETVGNEKYLSEEPMSPIDWELGDSVKNVLGYDCNCASALINGRKWKVWFATEIPIQEGPWKLFGLPGLILEAETDDGMYLFTATGLQKTEKEIGRIYLAESYEKMSRKELWQAKRAFFDNPVGKLSSQFGVTVLKVSDKNGKDITNKRINLTRNELDFMETDY